MTALRTRLLDRAKALGRVPVVIVGAGINGLGVFHDLSLQGVDCLIVDAGDVCSGTSAAPSRMIHGGLKYLETGEFRLVRESVEERNRMLRNAPHLVRPLEMVIPTETAFGGELASIRRFLTGKGKLKRRGRWILKAGLATYDLYSRGNRVAPTHRMVSRQELSARFPGISDRFRHAGSYYDAQIEMPERLGLELALDGMAEGGSLALNHCALVGVENGKLVLEDRLEGGRFAVATDLVVNAAGPWIDLAQGAMGHRTKLISGTKGSHLMLDLPGLAALLEGRMLYFDPGDGRICLATALLGRVLLGSTDIPVTTPDSVCADDEIAYMLDALRGLFPGMPISEEQIVYTYSGVRPLPANDAADPGQVSRDHRIDIREPCADLPFAVLSLVGGKWTTYRAFAAEAADLVLERLGRARARSTEALAVGGGRGLSQDVGAWQSLVERVAGICGSRERAAILAHRYGQRALAVAALDDPPLATAPDIGAHELAFVLREELAATLPDIVQRRFPLALAGRLSLPMAEELSDHASAALGWSEARKAREVQALAEHMLSRHRIDIVTRRFV